MLASNVEDSSETAGVKPEEGGDDVKSAWPLCPGLHTCYNGWYRTKQDRKVEQIAKANLSSDCGLKFAHMKLESLVIVNQHVTVKFKTNFVQTARHIRKVS